MQNEERPSNEVTYKFSGEDLRKLAEQNPDYVLIKTSIEPRTINDEAVGVVVVVAEAYREGKTLLAKTTGCPVPPCTAP